MLSICKRENCDSIGFLLKACSPVNFLGRMVKIITTDICSSPADAVRHRTTIESKLKDRITTLVVKKLMPKLNQSNVCHETAEQIYKFLTEIKPGEKLKISLSNFHILKNMLFSYGNYIFHFNLVGLSDKLQTVAELHSFVIEKIGYSYRIHQTHSTASCVYSYEDWLRGLCEEGYAIKSDIELIKLNLDCYIERNDFETFFLNKIWNLVYSVSKSEIQVASANYYSLFNAEFQFKENFEDYIDEIFVEISYAKVSPHFQKNETL